MTDPQSTNLDPAGMETSFGFQPVAPADKQEKVNEVFHSSAKRYDLMNDFMSGGLHRLWKDAMVSMLAPPKAGPFKVLDMAGGTGDVAFRIARRGSPQTKITVGDINTSMLAVGQERAIKEGLAHQVNFQEINAEELPIADNSLDAYTIAFGIRNVPRVAQAVAEAKRVLKYGGRFLCLEFSNVDMPFLDKIYETYSFNVIPAIGHMVANDRESYRYLVESIRKFPSQQRFAEIIKGEGFSRVSYRNLSGGIVAIHSGWKL